MSHFAFHKSALAGLLLFGSQFLAQAQAISGSTPGFAVTTGIVGVAGAQTAQLNVLNLQEVIPGVNPALCPATLEFYDATGTLLKQLAVANILPSTAASLPFKPPVPSTAANARAQIRAVVVTPATVVANPGSGSMPTPIIPVSIGCNVMASLEIVDDSSGATHTFTTDLRAVSSFSVLPMSAVR
jgi:hypothetical protein